MFQTGSSACGKTCAGGVKGQHEGIVSEELLLRMQQVLNGNVPKKRIAKEIRDT